MAVTDELLDLPGVPEGLAARRKRQLRRGPNGDVREVRNRRGLAKLDQVELVPAGDPEPVTLELEEEAWVLQARTRRWATIHRRYGTEAMNRAVALARAAIVQLVCPVDERLCVGEPRSWVLTDEWAARAADAETQRDIDRHTWRSHALEAAGSIRSRWPALAEALTRAADTPLSAVTQALVHAARDLSTGVMHDGPRAFSMLHYGDSKVRDDIAKVLLDAGAPLEVLIALGVRRSSRLGIAGPVTLTVDETTLTFGALDGPVLIRADQPGLAAKLKRRVPLAIVENLQAAESLADQLPDITIAYTAGPPSDSALRLITELAENAERILLVPDADLGGVRIAERVLTAVPEAELIDIGSYEHPVRAAWPADGETLRALTDGVAGCAGSLAEACLQRRYPVEQELATVRAVKANLADSDG